MRPETLDKLYEVREYFLLQQPQEDERERVLLDYVDDIIDEVEE